MVRNEEKYQLAVKYRKRGFTYSEIANIVGVSKSTISSWLAKKTFSKKVKKENIVKAARENKKRISLLQKARAAERKSRYAEAVRSAETEFKHYQHSPLFIAGVMIYLTDGDLSDSQKIRISSTNVNVHRIFIRFLKDFFGLENKKISLWLALYPNMNIDKELKWWSRKTKLPVSQFGKTQVLNNQPKNVTHQGSGNTVVHSAILKRKLMRWLELMNEAV